MDLVFLLVLVVVCVVAYVALSFWIFNIRKENLEIDLEEDNSQYSLKKKVIIKYYRVKLCSVIVLMIMSLLPILNQAYVGVNNDGNKIVAAAIIRKENNENKDDILTEANESFKNIANTYLSIFVMGASLVLLKTLSDMQSIFVTQIDDLHKIEKFKPIVEEDVDRNN